MNPEKLKAVCKIVIDDYEDWDYVHEDRWFCKWCDGDSPDSINTIKHKPDCPVSIAHELLQEIEHESNE